MIKTKYAAHLQAGERVITPRSGTHGERILHVMEFPPMHVRIITEPAENGVSMLVFMQHDLVAVRS